MGCFERRGLRIPQQSTLVLVIDENEQKRICRLVSEYNISCRVTQEQVSKALWFYGVM